jgi:outer membrane protein assembly factor BamD
MVAFEGCSNYQKILKGTNLDAKYDAGVKYYEKKDYQRAVALFEELIPYVRGTKKAEKVYYYYCYCNYYTQDYLVAANDFDNFASTFPNSEFAEECAYMHAYCYYQDSPIYSLDQENTVKAINEFQLFINKHPQSNRIQHCNGLIDELRFKLETKDFQNAKLYYNIGDYRAAAVAFKNVITDYPSTHYKEEAMFLILKSNYLLAVNSVEKKKHDRYTQAILSYGEFKDNFISSRYIKEANEILGNCRKAVDKLTKSNS